MKIPASPRPLVPAALVFAGGIFLDRTFCIHPGFLLAGAILSTAAFILVFIKRSVPAASLVYVVIALAGAIGHHTNYHYVPSDDISHLTADKPVPVRLRGTVVCEPWYDNTWKGTMKRATYHFDVDHVSTDSGWREVSGRIRVRQYGGPEEIQYGAGMELTGTVSRPARPTGPGQFDYREYLESHCIRTLMYVSGSNARIMGRKRFGPMRVLAHHIRTTARNRIEENYTSEEGAILNAVLLGNRAGVPGYVMDGFAESGTMHLLAISGLHAGIIAGMAWWIFGRLGVSRRGTSVLVIAVIVLYAYVAGGRAPIVRATVMTSAFCLGILIDREGDVLNMLASAALVLLAVRPAGLFDAGFQLSFVAVAAIAGLMPYAASLIPKFDLEQEHVWWRSKRARYALLALVVSVLAWLGAAPLVARHFHLATPAVVIVSPMLVPIVGAVLALGAASIAVACVSPALASPVVYLTTVLLTLLKKTVLAVSAMPFSHQYVPDALLLTPYYIVLAALILLHLPRKGALAAMVIFVAWNACFGSVWDIIPRKSIDAVTMLDVGKGSCFVITSADGSTVVYDVGSTSFRQIGERRLAPLLWEKRVRRIDALILSHPQADHISGVREIVQRFDVAKIVVSEQFARFKEGRRLLDSLEDSGVPVTTVSQSRTMHFGSIRCDTVWPPPNKNFTSPNESSLVVMLTIGKHRILLTGDIEEEAVMGLLQNSEELACDVIQVPHHGRNMVLEKELAHAARADVALISDTYPELGTEAEEAYQKAGSKTYHSAGSGTVTIECRQEEGRNVYSSREYALLDPILPPKVPLSWRNNLSTCKPFPPSGILHACEAPDEIP